MKPNNDGKHSKKSILEKLQSSVCEDVKSLSKGRNKPKKSISECFLSSASRFLISLFSSLVVKAVKQKKNKKRKKSQEDSILCELKSTLSLMKEIAAWMRSMASSLFLGLMQL